MLSEKVAHRGSASPAAGCPQIRTPAEPPTKIAVTRRAASRPPAPEWIYFMHLIPLFRHIWPTDHMQYCIEFMRVTDGERPEITELSTFPFPHPHRVEEVVYCIQHQDDLNEHQFQPGSGRRGL